MKRNDWLLIAVVAAVAVIFLCIQNFKSGSGGTGIITVSVRGDLYGTYSLDDDRNIEINDKNRLVIKDGAAWMEWADCPDQICVGHQKICKDGESIICLPNQVVIAVENTATEGLDGLSG